MFCWKEMVSVHRLLEAKYWESIANTNLYTIQRYIQLQHLHCSCTYVPSILYKISTFMSWKSLQIHCLYHQFMHRWIECYHPRMLRQNIFTAYRKTEVFITPQRTSCSICCVHLSVAMLLPAAFKQSKQCGFINIAMQNKSISFLGEQELDRNLKT